MKTAMDYFPIFGKAAEEMLKEGISFEEANRALALVTVIIGMRKGMRQQDIARRLKTTSSTISRIVNGDPAAGMGRGGNRKKGPKTAPNAREQMQLAAMEVMGV